MLVKSAYADFGGGMCQKGDICRFCFLLKASMCRFLLLSVQYPKHSLTDETLFPGPDDAMMVRDDTPNILRSQYQDKTPNLGKPSTSPTNTICFYVQGMCTRLSYVQEGAVCPNTQYIYQYVYQYIYQYVSMYWGGSLYTTPGSLSQTRRETQIVILGFCDRHIASFIQ